MPVPVAQCGIEKHITDELVVALPHQGLVLSELQDMQGLVEEAAAKESDRHLGLGLVKLRFPADSEGHAAEGYPSGTTHLDRVMDEVRTRCHKRYGGWEPTIGKNRVLDGIDGARSGYVGGGGFEYPEPHDPYPAPGRAQRQRGRGVRVAVMDTGLYPHSRLVGTFLSGAGSALVAIRSRQPYSAGHGTFVSGLIVQQAPAVELEVHQVLSDAHAKTTAWHVATKMVQLARSGVSVLNLSLGCYTTDGKPPLVLARAVDVLSPAIVIVAAAGNHGDPKNTKEPLTPETPFWPAALDDVVAVGADDSNGGGRAPFSPDLPWVSLNAPGVNVVSTYFDGDVRVPCRHPECATGTAGHNRHFGGYAAWSGTSFAAATVSGEIAARTVPGRRTAFEALQQLLDLRPGSNGRAAGHGIRPYHFGSDRPG